MKKVAFYTLGCKLNYSETSTIARQVSDKGYQTVDFLDTPDVFIINTCSVTDNADKKCQKLVKEALRISPHAYIAIIGCFAQLKPNEIANIEGVDAVLGAAEKFMLPELIPTFEKKGSAQILASSIEQATKFHSSYSYGDRTRSFLKLQDGCNYNCAFCTIPLARGESRSDSIANIVRSAQEIAQTDVKEIVLTGVNTGDFGIQNGRRKEKFIDLIKSLDEVEGIERFRISSIEPNLLTEEIIEFVAQSNKFVPHFHIPLQSGSDKILKSMHRRYNTALYAQKIETIKKHMPFACIGVDVIVGFPSESESDFLETYQFLNDLEISYLHVFTYSERPNTPALDIKQVVPHQDRNKRSKMLHILSEKKKRFFYEQNIGRNMKILVEKEQSDHKLYGFSENYIRFEIDYDPLHINEIVPVQMGSINHQMFAEGVVLEEVLLH